MLAWSGARRRSGSLVALALLVAIGLGVTLASAETAARTDRAYGDYLREARVSQLVVNPSLSTARAGEIIAATPGVAGLASDDFLIATFDEGEPRTQSEVDSATIQLRMSADGRYVRQDRPVVHEGRMLRDGREAFLGRELADELGARVGDEIPIAFWSPSYTTSEIGPSQDDLVAPIGRSSARVVGIGALMDEVLVDELYPRQRAIVTPEVAGDYTCTFDDPAGLDPDLKIQELFSAIVPPDCALAYRYYGLQLDGPDAATVADRLVAAFDEENARLPIALREADVGYELIPTALDDQRDRVERSLQPTVTALRLFALAAGAATVVVLGLAAARLVRTHDRDVEVWRQLGVTRSARFVALAIPLAAAVLAGLLGAVAVGWLGSVLGPVASARVLVPHRPFGLAGDVVLLVVGLGAFVLLAMTAGVAAVAVGRRPSTRVRRPSPAAHAVRVVGPARGLGIRAATESRGAAVVLVGAATAVGVVLASAGFSASIDRLVDEPDRYGWPYDAAVVVGFGYGGADEEAIAESLDRPDVERWATAALDSVTIAGETMAAVAGRDRFDTVPLPVVTGRLPAGAGEIALGSKSAEQLGVEVGDRIQVASYYGTLPATVTGTVVLPPLGPFESDRAAPGTGALLSAAFFDALVEEAEQAAGLPPGSFEETGLTSFVGIDLREGVDAHEFVDSLRGDELLSWDRNGFASLTYADPVRPAVIADVADMRAVPVALGGFFAVAMAGGLAVSIAVAARSRRRELAVLRALGGVRRQAATSVRWHAGTVVAVAVAIGGPLGVIAGIASFRRFADDLGVVSAPEVTAAGIAAVAAAAFLVGLLASAVPSRQVGRECVAAVLRSE
jgi:hypothetical protein